VTGREERRRLAYRWLRRGLTKAEVARRLEVSWTAVNQWDKRRRTEGPNSWREKRHPGAVPKLTLEQKTRLKAILLQGARAYGYPTDLWTLKRTAEVIRKEWKVRYSVAGVWRVLRALGLSAQVPLKRALERNERYIRHWVRAVWPSLLREAWIATPRWCSWMRVGCRPRPMYAVAGRRKVDGRCCGLGPIGRRSRSSVA
jgi:transposase